MGRSRACNARNKASPSLGSKFYTCGKGKGNQYSEICSRAIVKGYETIASARQLYSASSVKILDLLANCFCTHPKGIWLLPEKSRQICGIIDSNRGIRYVCRHYELCIWWARTDGYAARTQWPKAARRPLDGVTTTENATSLNTSR